MKKLTIAALTFSLACSLTLFAREIIPENALPLSKIVKMLEDNGFTKITSISLDKGVWEADVYVDGVKRELTVDTATGKILSNKLDD
ncbi:PepSY domain-containing protein [Pontiellaceae bacterium B12219]|nr:PepSY domain-containing protein [Pontiellaceae bacterium B12219]